MTKIDNGRKNDRNLSGREPRVVAILKGFLDVPKWFVLFNPFVFLFVGVGLRKIKPEWFYDLPGIILPSLGMGMYGLITIVNMY